MFISKSLLPLLSTGVMFRQGEKKEERACFFASPTCLLFLPSSHSPCSLCPSPGVVSQQDNVKTFSVSSTIRIPVERKDNGAALSCEAFHPALAGQRRIRHYRLDVYCESPSLSLAHARICVFTFYIQMPLCLGNKLNTIINGYLKNTDCPICISVTYIAIRYSVLL